MALSVCQFSRSGPVWPLGFVAVAASGSPVNIMANVDANNNNAPGTQAPVAGSTQVAGYTPTCHKIFFQGYKPAANNNGMVPNSGNVYVMVAPAGGNGNKIDAGAMVMIIPPASGGTWPAMEFEQDTVSPYSFFLDADVSGEGALVTLQI